MALLHLPYDLYPTAAHGGGPDNMRLEELVQELLGQIGEDPRSRFGDDISVLTQAFPSRLMAGSRSAAVPELCGPMVGGSRGAGKRCRHDGALQ